MLRGCCRWLPFKLQQPGNRKVGSNMNKKLFNIRLNLCSGSGEPSEPNDPPTEPDITQLQNSILEMQNQINTLKENNEKLTQHNQQLFLKVTGEVTPKDKIDNLKEYKEYVGDEFFNSLSNKQQKLLITILEGEDE